jgi:hypothetical protein
MELLTGFFFEVVEGDGSFLLGFLFWNVLDGLAFF